MKNMKTKLLSKIRKQITIQKVGTRYYLIDKISNIENEFYDVITYKEMLNERRNKIIYNAYKIFNKKTIITKKGY